MRAVSNTEDVCAVEYEEYHYSMRRAELETAQARQAPASPQRSALRRN